MRVKVKRAAVFISVMVLMNSAESLIRKGDAAAIVSTNVRESIFKGIDITNFDMDNKGLSLSAVNHQDRKKVLGLEFKAYDEKILSKMGFKAYTEVVNKTRDFIDFGPGEGYSLLKGVTTFRGNNLRDGGSYGTADIKDEKLKVIWMKDIGAIDSWTGVGWNGQPAIVQWEKTVISDMNIYPEKKSVHDLREVIYGTLDGNVYFLDLEDGKDTRPKLKIGAPIKGSVTIDPRGIPILYIGQGIDWNGSSHISFAYRIFSLIDFGKLYEIKGNDAFARRSWGAFDSTALIDRFKDYLFICGENGIVYSGKLNTVYEDGKVTVSPKIDKYRYDAVGKYTRGIESSIAIYENYGFFSDNDGLVQCLDLNTLTPLWVFDATDDSDSTIVLEREKGGLSLYTACEVDLQGPGGYSYIRKIDASSGRLIWENKYKCAFDSNVNGGVLATPVVGKNDISNLVIFSIARTPEYGTGYLIAFDKETGSEKWRIKLDSYTWSSPLAIYSNSGKSYVIQCDSVGKVILIEGISGRILDTIQVGANIEGSPAAFGNKVVVGTRGGKIVAFEVR